MFWTFSPTTEKKNQHIRILLQPSLPSFHSTNAYGNTAVFERYVKTTIHITNGYHLAQPYQSWEVTLENSIIWNRSQPEELHFPKSPTKPFPWLCSFLFRRSPAEGRQSVWPPVLQSPWNSSETWPWFWLLDFQQRTLLKIILSRAPTSSPLTFLSH